MKPSSSTVRGMLPSRQFRALDAAMQSLRSAGLRLDWQWKDKKTGWVCLGLLDSHAMCELRPTEEPLVGHIMLTRKQVKLAQADEEVPKSYREVLKYPIDEKSDLQIYEFELSTTPERDFYSDFVEAVRKFVELDVEE